MRNIKSSILYIFILSLSLFIIGVSCKPTLVPSTTPPKVETVIPKKEIVENPVVIKVGNTEIDNLEFKEYVGSNSISLKSEELVNEFIFNKLVYNQAIEEGYGNDDNLKNELASYRDMIYENYRYDSSLIKKVSNEAYRHLLEDVEVAHILYFVPQYEDQKKKSEKLNEIKAIRNKIINNELTFEQAAKLTSADNKSSENGGYLGWFTGLQLIYPLEKTAYNLAIGEISEPVETEFGFHLVKLINKRTSRGRVTVQHLLRVVPPQATSEIEQKQQESIAFLYNQLKNGANFDSLVLHFSDDFRTRENKGILNEFWIGSREEKTVEEAVFNLNVGEISQPVKSSAGWHIFRLLRKSPVPPYEIIKNELESKITTDSRGEYIDKQWIDATKASLKFNENPSVISQTLALATPSLKEKKWVTPKSNPILDSYLFSIQGNSISVKDFLEFVEEKQSIKMPKYLTTETQLMNFFYAEFEKSVVKKYADNNLELVNSDFKNTLQSYKEGIIVSNYLTNAVFQKAILDSAGLNSFYLKNATNYHFNERAFVTEIISNDDNSLQYIEGFLQSEKPFNLKRGILPIYFSKNSTYIEEKDEHTIRQLSQFLKKYPNYIVEIGGHADINEADNVSKERIDNITTKLMSYSIPITRINELDYGKTSPIDKFDWQRNQRVTFRFFTSSIKDLARIANEQGYKVEIEEDIIEKSELLKSNGIEWKQGTYNSTLEDGKHYKLIINEIYPARQKSFREAKTEVIKGYQEELKKELFEKLRKKYPIEVNEKQLNSIIKENIQKNK